MGTSDALGKDPEAPNRFNLFVIIFLAVVAACTVLGAFDPDNNKFLNLEEYSPLQNLQAGLLGLALILNIAAIFRTEGQARSFWILLLAVSFFYAWRELDLDKEFLGARMFSWKYLTQSEEKLPFKYKLLMAIPSISMTVLWLGHFLIRFRSIYRGTLERIQPLTVFWGAIHFIFFFVAQVWDKATMIRRHVKLNIHDMAHKDPFAEEAMELLGEVAFLFFILTLWNLKPKAPREAWAGARNWLRTDAGKHMLRIAGSLTAAVGLTFAALTLSNIFAYQPSEFEYLYTATFSEGTRQTSFAYQGLSQGQIIFYGLGLGLGGMLLGAGAHLFTATISKLRILGVIVFAALLSGLPFILLKPSKKRNMRIQVLIGPQIPNATLESLRTRLEPQQALASLPEGCQHKLHLGPKHGFKSWTLTAAQNTEGVQGLECSFEFVRGLRTRQRSTLSEFYMHALEALTLESAHQSGLPLKIYSTPDFDPYAFHHVTMAEGDWHRWRKKWINSVREGALGKTP